MVQKIQIQVIQRLSAEVIRPLYFINEIIQQTLIVYFLKIKVKLNFFKTFNSDVCKIF